jgi:hypothetical protein
MRRHRLEAALVFALSSPFFGCGAGGCLYASPAPPASAARAQDRAPDAPEARAEDRSSGAAPDPRFLATPSPSSSPEPAPTPAHVALPELPVAGTPALPDPASLEPTACFALLDAHGVRYRRARGDDGADGYITLEGPIAGITIEFVGRNAVHARMDCRVAEAILAWAPDLRALGVHRLRHLSIFRPGAVVQTTGRPSGHAGALAMDVRYFDFDDGRTLDVLADWGDRTHDADPCPAELYAERDPSPEIRALVCAAVERGLFRTVITPHHDDPHQNHVHLEVVPGVDWRFIH